MANTGFLYIPIKSYEGQAAPDANKFSCVGFDANGNLVSKGENEFRGQLTVSQQEYPYNALMKQLETRALKIVRTRMTVQTDGQIDNSITHFKRGTGGKMCTNSIDGRAYLQPTQYQGKIIDIDQEFIIDRYSGFYFLCKAGEQVNFAFFERSGLQFNISVHNTSFVDLYAELFAPLDSISKRKKPEYVNNDVVNSSGTAAVFLDGLGWNDIDYPAIWSPMQAGAGHLTDYVEIINAQLVLRTGFAGSRFIIKLPAGAHGTFLGDYSLDPLTLTFVSAFLSGGYWVATLDFVGYVPLNITTNP